MKASAERKKKGLHPALSPTLSRAAGLSSVRRTEIARHAATMRWETKMKPQGPSFLPSVRLQAPRWEDPVYLEEILTYGTLHDWRELYGRLENHPFGSEAQALQRVCDAVWVYGVTILWKGILQSLQGGPG